MSLILPDKALAAGINRLSDAVSALYQPKQIRRIAEAEADAAKIRAAADQEIAIAVLPALAQEQREDNIKAVLEQAAPLLNDDCTPPDVDWFLAFLESCAKRSNPDWHLWLARVLAGEANTPGSTPLRFIIDLARLDKTTVETFLDWCGWYIPELGTLVTPEEGIADVLTSANLVIYGLTFQLNIESDKGIGFFIHHQQTNEGITLPTPVILKAGKHALPVGMYQMTSFGKFLFSKIDPRPIHHPQFRSHIHNLWKDYIDFDANLNDHLRIEVRTYTPPNSQEATS